MAVTKKQNVVQPEILGSYLENALIKKIRLTPVVFHDNTMVGVAGTVLTLPKYEYIGQASIVGENEEVVPKALQTSTEEVEIVKCGSAIDISVEAKQANYGNIVDMIGENLADSIADKVEEDLFAEMRKAEKEITVAKFDKDAIADALAEFGESAMDREAFVFVNGKQFAELRKDESFYVCDDMLITGERGRVFGARIVLSDRVAENEVLVMQEGALALVHKKELEVEYDKNILAQVETYVAFMHYCTQLRYPDRVCKIKIG
jgi:hypothetical protein